jgi:hypothetical protein
LEVKRVWIFTRSIKYLLSNTLAPLHKRLLDAQVLRIQPFYLRIAKSQKAFPRPSGGRGWQNI